MDSNGNGNPYRILFGVNNSGTLSGSVYVNSDKSGGYELYFWLMFAFAAALMVILVATCVCVCRRTAGS